MPETIASAYAKAYVRAAALNRANYQRRAEEEARRLSRWRNDIGDTPLGGAENQPPHMVSPSEGGEGR